MRNGDGSYFTSVKINEGEYGKEQSYTNNNGIAFGIGKENSIPPEISDLIIQTSRYKEIIEDVKSDSITKVNAIKELKKLYDKISQVAIKELTMDEKGNIGLKDFEQTKETEKEIGD